MHRNAALLLILPCILLLTFSFSSESEENSATTVIGHDGKKIALDSNSRPTTKRKKEQGKERKSRKQAPKEEEQRASFTERKMKEKRDEKMERGSGHTEESNNVDEKPNEKDEEGTSSSSSFPSWRGIECFKGTTLSDPRLTAKCPIEHFCEKQDSDSLPCGQYAEGKWSDPITDEVLKAIHQKLLKDGERCKREQLDGVILPKMAIFTNNRSKGVLKHHTCPQFQYFSPGEVLSILREVGGKRVLFTGDSMARQTYLRLIALLRGQDVMADHYYHQDSYYVIFPSRDALIVTKKIKPKVASNIHEEEPLLEMYFHWDPRPSTFRKEFLAVKPTLHIASYMFWWQNKDPAEQIDKYFSFMTDHISKQNKKANGDDRYRYMFVTTPWTAPKTFGGVEDKNRLPRNAKAVKWLTSLQAVPRIKPHVHLVDFAGIAALVKFPKTKDGIHYQCIWTPKYPELANNQKHNKNECRDPMNLAVLNWLVAILDSSR